IGLGDAHGPAEHGEREAPRFYLEALLFGLRLGQTYTGDLRVCEDDARNRDPVLGGSFAGDHFGANLALLGGFVSQHGRPADIPDGENAFDVRLTQLVGLNEASGIDLDSELLQSKPSRARLHAYRDQHHVARELLSLAIPGGRDHQRTVRLTLVALGARGLQHGTPVLDDLTFYDFDAIGVGSRQVRRGELGHGSLAAEGLVHHAELEPDHPAANHHQALRYVPEADRLARPDHSLAVELEPRHLNRRRAGGDHDALFGGGSFDGSRLRLDFYRTLAHELGRALHQFDAVRLEQPPHTAGQLFDDAIFPILHLIGVYADGLDGNAVRSHGLRLGIEVCVGDQGLGWNASPIEANPTDLLFFDAQGLLSQLAQADGANIATRPTTDHNRVKLSIDHAMRLPESRAPDNEIIGCAERQNWAGL